MDASIECCCPHGLSRGTVLGGWPGVKGGSGMDGVSESLKANGIYLSIHITPVLGAGHTRCTCCLVLKKLGSSFQKSRKLRL